MYNIFMKYKNIIVTGGRGFIMFNGLKLWKSIYPECNFICIDNNTYADKFMQKEKNNWLDTNNILRFVIDLSNDNAYYQLCDIVEKYNIDAIIHGAAESHVDNSLNDPNIFFKSNVLGTANILNVAKKYNLRITIVSTDEVYGETTPDDWEDVDKMYNIIDVIEHPEEKPLVPSSPYSSSKASADMIALSYHRTFGTQVTVSRCTNNFGKYQHCEKLIGTVISKALKNEKIPVYGKGNQKRHWIHVDEHNRMVMNILEKGKVGKIYNIAPPKESWITNMTLIKFILKTLNKSNDLIEHVTDRLGHDTSYFLYGTDFCQSDKNWKKDMIETINWYKENYNESI